MLRAAFVDAGWHAIFVNCYNDDLPKIAQGCDHICVVGGDGSLRDAIEKLANIPNSPPLSMYPAGTINLVAREAGYPTNVKDFVARITGLGKNRHHYHGLANGKPLVVCASVGPDSAAVANVSQQLKRRIGRFAYVAAFGKLLWQWPRSNIQVEADGKTMKGEAAFILNGRYFAGQFTLNPKADLTVPNFQILVLPTARRRDYFRLALSAVIHPIFASKAWHEMPASSVTVRGDIALPVQIDGDIAATLPLSAAIGKNAWAYR